MELNPAVLQGRVGHSSRDRDPSRQDGGKRRPIVLAGLAPWKVMTASISLQPPSTHGLQ